VKPKRILTIAGSDSGGGAGIQADLKTFMALGMHGMSALTALTAQNTIGVDAAKTGMLSSAAIVEAVSGAVRDFDIPNLVCDPVFVSKHGDALLSPDAVGALRTELIPLARIITPNVPEAEGLLGRELSKREPDEDAAIELAKLGCEWVYLKGGHLSGDAVDLLCDGSTVIRLEAPRIPTEHTHGTGCTLSAALAANLAKGLDVPDAAAEAKRFVTRAIERHLEIGRGIGPVNPAWGF